MDDTAVQRSLNIEDDREISVELVEDAVPAFSGREARRRTIEIESKR